MNRTQIVRRAIRTAAVAGALAVTVGTAGGATSAFAATNAHPNGYAPVEECLNWSGTVNYFPGLGTTTKTVTAVLNATLSNCNSLGTGQTYGGTVFGDLTGTATKSGATLTGNVAITWPQDSGFNPTIVPITLSGSNNAYSLYGTGSAGAFTGDQLEGSYAKISSKAISGGTSQSILGSQPFGMFINEG